MRHPITARNRVSLELYVSSCHSLSRFPFNPFIVMSFLAVLLLTFAINERKQRNSTSRPVRAVVMYHQCINLGRIHHNVNFYWTRVHPERRIAIRNTVEKSFRSRHRFKNNPDNGMNEVERHVVQLHRPSLLS